MGRKRRSSLEEIWPRGKLGVVEDSKKNTGGGCSTTEGLAAAWVNRGDERKNCRAIPPGASYMRPPRGHRTLLMWHRTRPVTTGLKHREVFKSRNHRTMATGRWL